MLIIDLIPLKKRKIWKIAVCSVVDSFSIITNIYLGIMFLFMDEEVYFMAYVELIANTLGIIIAFIITLMMIFDGTRLFKSRRAKNFENAQKGKNSKIITKRNIGIISVVGSCIFIALLILSIIGNNVTNIIVFTICLALSLGTFIYSFFMGLKGIKTVFFIKTKYEMRIFQGSLKSKDNINAYLGRISDYYFINDFGHVLKGKEKYQLCGIILDDFDVNLYGDIKLEQVQYPFIKEAVKNIDKKTRKTIIFDDDNKIVSIKEIK